MGKTLREVLCSSKMAEDSKQRKEDLPPSPAERDQPELKEISGEHSQQLMPSQLSKEKLHQQRQKCELKRLLKHTHPELKMLDDVVDEEFADILCPETETAGETGYEGEVLSRCLIFENRGLSNNMSSYTPKIHTAQEPVQRCDFSKPLAEKTHTEGVKRILEHVCLDIKTDLKGESEEEMKRIDVQATKMIFENQSFSTCRSNPDTLQGNAYISENETKVIKKPNEQSEMSCTETQHISNQGRNKDLEERPLTNNIDTVWCADGVGQRTEQNFSEEVPSDETPFEEVFTSLSDSERQGETIKTRAVFFQNNPFISTNFEKQHSFGHKSKAQNQDGIAGEDYLPANVKNRTHLFESMPFDKIRHQNKDEIETLVENIKETLNSLYHVKAIHSAGAIIEVNETMIAKKAKFIISANGPELKYDEVAEGGAQNFILQLLPRVNLKPHITYLKENSKGEVTVVEVPVREHQPNTNKDTEFKTAKVVQLIEDILNQDNSLRKGLIIQEDVNNCSEVIVYSLFKYFDEENVKSYSPPQSEDEPEIEIMDGRTIRGPQETSQDQTKAGSIRPEEKGNVKLFRSCIEKGDLEYLKTLREESETQEQVLPPNQTVNEQSKEPRHEQIQDQAEESNTEWVPVDVKKLKSMFSGDKSNNQESCIQSTTIRKSLYSCEQSIEAFGHPQRKNICKKCGAHTQDKVFDFKVMPPFKIQDDDRIHKAQPTEMEDGTVEISHLETAVHNLKETKIKSQSFCHPLQETEKKSTQDSSDKPLVTVTVANVKHSRPEAELFQENMNQKMEACTELSKDDLPSASNGTTGHKPDWQYKNTETCHEDVISEKVPAGENCGKESQPPTEMGMKQHIETDADFPNSSEISPAQDENEEVVFQGKLQAALESLERSNVNVARGDFKAAMIYRNSHKPHQERSQNVDAVSVQKANIDGLCSVTEPQSAQVMSIEASKPTHQTETQNKPPADVASGKRKRPTGPKPAIPPKPEHLRVKQQVNQSTTSKNLNATQINKRRSKETVSQPSSVTLVSCKDECKKDQFKSDSESVDHQRKELLGEAVQVLQETEMRHQVQGLAASSESHQSHKCIINGQQQINATEDEKSPQNEPGKDDLNNTDENHVDFHEACKKFGGSKTLPMKTAPPKPKRLNGKNSKHPPGDITVEPPVSANVAPKPAQNTSCNTSGLTADSKDKHKDIQVNKVEMREKKGRVETEDERRQRLSVHMDEIMRGNITAAMEIFDNLRKQEQLQNILSRVEEIERDTSKVDVRSLRKVFENVPDWVVSSDKRKQNKVGTENKDKKMPLTKDRTESQPSMAHVYGDLERASEEIMNLKEQTLARLMDIEEAIRKALFSVSTLKSDSDIAGLSCLFKESLGSVQSSSSSGNISKISIGSSRKKSQEAQESFTTQRNTAGGAAQGESFEEASAKQQPSPPTTPSFISIQSAARKMNKSGAVPPTPSICPTCQRSPKSEERFRTTKTLTCNSPAQSRKVDPGKEGQKLPTFSPLNSRREISVLEVQTDREGNSVIATKTNDDFGNRYYSSKAVIATPPETLETTNQAVISPSTYVSGHHLSRGPAASQTNYLDT